jgi:hypothetical protein
MYADISFTKSNFDDYLRELGKEYRRLVGKKITAEIILVGGAAVLAKYGFRETTYDFDAIIVADSAMKEAINKVGNNHNLPLNWINSDFMNTDSSTPKLRGVSVYYKTFSNVLQVRTVANEYLVAMKLVSGRRYKNDLSDIVGIIREHQETGEPLTAAKINNALTELYGETISLPKASSRLLDVIFETDDYDKLYNEYRQSEITAHKALLEFDKNNKGTLNESNIDEIIEMLVSKSGSGDSDGKLLLDG